MLPALTTRTGPLPRTRALFIAAVVLMAIAVLSAMLPMSAEPPPISLADELRPDTIAIQVPAAWLAAPLPSARPGDQIDILGVRPGDRAYTVPIVYAATLVMRDERGLVLQVDERDASAIATARGSGLLLVPLLRSTR